MSENKPEHEDNPDVEVNQPDEGADTEINVDGDAEVNVDNGADE